MSDNQTLPDGVELLSLVYTGRVFVNGKIQHQWIDAGPVQNRRLSGAEYTFKKQLLTVGVGVCVVFKVVKKDKNISVYTNKTGALMPVVNGTISGFIDQRREWQARDSAVGLELRRQQMNARLAKGSPMLAKHFEVLNHQYQKLPPSQRAAFLAHCIKEITK